jgi:hypothetical protein
MQIFISTVLTHRQRMLLLFQRKMLISEVEENQNRLEQENKQYDIKRKILSSKTDEMKLGVENMTQILLKYTGDQAELDKLDITLLKGVYKDDPFALQSEPSSFDSDFNESIIKDDDKFHDEETRRELLKHSSNLMPSLFLNGVK